MYFNLPSSGTKNLWEWSMYVKRWSRIQAKIEKPIHIATTSTKGEKMKVKKIKKNGGR